MHPLPIQAVTHKRGMYLVQKPWKFIYINTHCSDYFTILAVTQILQLQVVGSGQAGHFTLWNSLCATYKRQRRTMLASSEDHGSKMRSQKLSHMQSSFSQVVWALKGNTRAHHIFSTCTLSASLTYTMVPCMQEVKEFFCAILLSIGSGVDAGLTDLQTLLHVHTVFSLLTLGS